MYIIIHVIRLQFIKTKISLTINENKIRILFQSLMLGSSYLQLGRVQHACAEFLRTRLSPNNVLGVRGFADTLGCSSLVLACNKFVKKHFTDVAESEEFLGLPISEVKFVTSSFFFKPT